MRTIVNRLGVDRKCLALLVLFVGLACAILFKWLQASSQYIDFIGGCSVNFSVDAQYRNTFCGEEAPMSSSFSSAYFQPKESGIQFEHFGSRRSTQLSLEGANGDVVSVEVALRANTSTQVNYKLPESHRNQLIRLVVPPSVDGAWVMLGKLQNQSFAKVAFKGFVDLVAKVTFYSSLFAMLYLTIRLICRETITLLLLPVVMGVVGYLGFWLYYIDRSAGYVLSMAFFVAIAVGAGLSIKRQRLSAVVESATVLAPLGAYVLFALAIALFPFEHGISSDNVAAAIRWRDMPVDNWVPKIFADQIWAGEVKVPMFPEWLSSDRPPLQTGINLLFFPISTSGLHYQVISTWLQAMVFLPIYVLLRQFNMSKASFWVLLGLAFSGFFVANAVFVWPKLISACYLLTIYCLLFTKIEDEFSPRARVALIAFSGCFAMLSHGGALFGLLAMYIYFALTRIRSVFSVGITSGLAMVLLYLPWIFYQRVLDPPGDRLLKWHFAGYPPITDKPFVELLSAAYASLTFDEWLLNKFLNLWVITNRATEIHHWVPELFKVPVDLPLIDFLQDITFSIFFFSFWFFSPIIALAIYVVSRIFKRSFDRELTALVFVSLIGLAVWILLLFLPRSTSIHHGTFLLWLTVYLASCVMLYRAHIGFLILVTVLNSIMFVQFYVLDYVYLQRNGIAEYIVMSGFVGGLLLMSFWAYSFRDRKNAVASAL